MPGQEERIERPVARLPNTYQVLKLPGGTHFTRPRPDREASRFWNEGRWRTFVEPLLPKATPDMTFVEMGSDCGLYLKMASDYGFGRAIGIEKNRTPVRIGREWRDTIGGDWKLLKRKLGGAFGEAGTFDLGELPVADVTLMSCWHYYIDINAWMRYLDRLVSKTCYVLVVSRPELDNGHWMAQADLPSVLGYFDGWGCARWIPHLQSAELADDPKPRPLYAILLQSPVVERVPIADVDVGGRMQDETAELASLIARCDTFDPMQTAFAERWRERKPRWSDRTLRRFVEGKVAAMESVRDDGLKEALVVQQDTMKLSDGGHRLAVLKALGHQSVIVRPV
jgi:hypothetical protein